MDKPALKPLPVAPYVYAEWKKCRAGIDYHIAIDKHYYSVPYQLLRKELWVRITARTVEFFHIGQRVASHVRTSGNGQHSTQRDHVEEKFTGMRCRAIAAQVMSDDVVALFELTLQDDEVKVVEERHHRLVPAKQLDQSAIRDYRD
ncbi:hypothetical protein GLR48_11460 [Loktanella sp. M215]|nr:hypothetical protein [Loktanella sp. M215]